jgi:hypothetical protein
MHRGTTTAVQMAAPVQEIMDSSIYIQMCVLEETDDQTILLQNKVNEIRKHGSHFKRKTTAIRKECRLMGCVAVWFFTASHSR